MFGLFRRKVTTHDVVSISIMAAGLCRTQELENGDTPCHPAFVDAAISEGAKEGGFTLSSTERQVAEAFVLKLLLERDFISELVERVSQGTFGPLSVADQRRVKAILPEAFA